MSNALLIGAPTQSAGGANLVLGSQPQFPAPYPPYHTAHLATRPALISTHGATTLPPGTAFRSPAAAYHTMQHNGEIIYPYPTQVATVGGGAPLTFLPTASASVVSSTQSLQTIRSAGTSQPPPQTPQQQVQSVQQPPLIQQKVPTAYTPPAIVAAVPLPHPPSATTPTGMYSALSCFNCGSQKHTGLDCQEASMEDVTRNSVYKLDYNAAIAAASC